MFAGLYQFSASSNCMRTYLPISLPANRANHSNVPIRVICVIRGLFLWERCRGDDRTLGLDFKWRLRGRVWLARRHPRRAKQSRFDRLKALSPPKGFAPKGVPKCNLGTSIPFAEDAPVGKK